MACRFTLITSPEPTSVFIPAPILVVRRLANGQEMARFPATSHRLARRMARHWFGRVEVIVPEAETVSPNDGQVSP